MTMYDQAFYHEQQVDSLKSARGVVPHVLNLIQPRSVVDVGCGVGTWLSVFKENGVGEILGIDGEYVRRDMLHIGAEEFRPFDLSQPFELDRRFDLAISLEVAEHLPHTSAANFVRTLTRLAPVNLFSAAIPLQGGVNHINEQWPEYWRRLFENEEFVMIDCLRNDIWELDDIKPHYAQNTFFYVQREALDGYPALKAQYESGTRLPLALVHPGIFEFRITRLAEDTRLKPGNYRLTDLLRVLPVFAFTAVKSTLKRSVLALCALLGIDRRKVLRSR